MNRIIIVTGGSINEDFARKFIEINEYNYIIAVDGGLRLLHKIDIEPNCLVGDFDTIDKEILEIYTARDDIEVIRLIPEKDYTDTHTAILKAIDFKPDEICILGGTGSRLDHTISNIQLLLLPLKENIKARIINENNTIYLIDSDTIINKSETHGEYISLIPFEDSVKGVTLEGFKYPLDDYDFDKLNSISLGVSNELIKNIGKIRLKSGILLVIEAKD